MRWRKAVQFLDEMEKKRVRQDVYSYSGAIAACEKDNQWKKALELFSKMERKGIQPNIVTFNSAISACGKGSM